MRAIYFADGVAEQVVLPVAVPGPDEALVRVLTAGICNTDLELLHGYYGFEGVPGHEFVGRVVSCPGERGREGQRVAADINCGCGVCARCATGDPRHCAARRSIGISGRAGAFAEYLTVPVANLHPVPEGVSDEEAVFAEPLAAALEVGQQIHILGSMSVAVLGDGKLGLLCALGLRFACPGLLLIGRHERKLALASAQGVRTLCCPAGSRRDILGAYAGSFDLVVEATGSPEGIGAAIALTRPEGAVALKTTSRLPSSVDFSRVVVNELRLIGSRCGDLRLALEYLSAGRLDVRPLVEAVYPLSDFSKAVAAAAQPGALKVLLDCSG